MSTFCYLVSNSFRFYVYSKIRSFRVLFFIFVSLLNEMVYNLLSITIKSMNNTRRFNSISIRIEIRSQNELIWCTLASLDVSYMSFIRNWHNVYAAIVFYIQV
jgi:hypothetical protein